MSPDKVQKGEYVEVLQGQVHIGKELTKFQLLLKEYFFSCLSFGTCFFYGIQILCIFVINWYLDYKRQQRENERMDYDDGDDDLNDVDVSEDLGFEEMTNNDNDGINRNNTNNNDNSIPRNEAGNDDNTTTMNQNYYEETEEYYDGEEGEWEDLPQSTGNNSQSSSRRAEGTDNYNDTGTPNQTNNSHTIPDE